MLQKIRGVRQFIRSKIDEAAEQLPVPQNPS